MRISDWSSDVCSSDLPGGFLRRSPQEQSKPFRRRRHMRLKHFRCRVPSAATGAGAVMPAGSTYARRRPYSPSWFSQVAAMSKPPGTAAASLRQVAAALQSFAGPAALAIDGPGAAQLRLLGANRAFAEATGCDAATLCGRDLAELCDVSRGGPAGAAGGAGGNQPIDLRPLFDRKIGRAHV